MSDDRDTYRGELDDPFGIRAIGSSSASGNRVLKHGDTFAVLDRGGDIPFDDPSVHGLFHAGTRFLSGFELRLQREPLLLLSSGVSDENVLTVDLTNADVQDDDHDVPHGTLHVLRKKLLWDGACYERWRVENFGPRPVDLELELSWSADFSDVFELRGMSRPARGKMREPVVRDTATELAYDGLDGVRRTTCIEIAPPPERLDGGRARFRFHLESRQCQDVEITVTCRVGDEPRPVLVGFDRAVTEARTALATYRRASCRVDSSNPRFDAWLHRSDADLWLMATETAHGPFPYAGIPWYSTPFGRDSIITALLAGWVKPDAGRGVLRYLAAHQAEELDDARDAEPGKIFHEFRLGEMAELREVPFGRYYGSVDSTPLFLMLADAYHESTGDLDLVEALWPNLLRAIAWMERHGDHDGDGFLEYGTRAGGGLVQQGWKDSHDSVFHADGAPAEGPIALAEVQGYAYAAFRAGARLSQLLGHGREAERLSACADTLADRFDAAFWCEDLQTFALALDGRKRQCRVRTSNAGHCLYTGIARPERARAIADGLLARDMFSGWGIRTLSTRERHYNPLSYHNGSVWPHDNAIIGLGLARYDLKGHAARVLEAIFEGSQLVAHHRTPELYCGFERRSGQGPTLYPVACAPQAWAAASVFGLLRAVLGLRVQADPPRLTFDRPVLPRFLDEIVLDGLIVGSERVTVRLHRYPDDVGVNVARRTGPVAVTVVK
jgi:glycogen debranching enzyme